MRSMEVPQQLTRSLHARTPIPYSPHLRRQYLDTIVPKAYLPLLELPVHP